jgi:hypothetical protein
MAPPAWQSGELQLCHLFSTDKAAIFSHNFSIFEENFGAFRLLLL